MYIWVRPKYPGRSSFLPPPPPPLLLLSVFSSIGGFSLVRFTISRVHVFTKESDSLRLASKKRVEEPILLSVSSFLFFFLLLRTNCSRVRE